jgi:signal recognition particle subunit SRP72
MENRQKEMTEITPSPPPNQQSHAEEVAELPTMATNLAAAMVAAGRSADLRGLVEKFKITPKQSFELAFNLACGLIETDELSDATDYLLLARRLGHETLLDEDLGEEEIEDELLPVAVQTAYVAELVGLSLPGGADWSHGPYWLSLVGVFD